MLTRLFQRRTLLVIVVLVTVLAGFVIWRNSKPDPVIQAPPATLVLLIPGYGGGTDAFDPLKQKLSQAGVPYVQVDIGTGHGDLSEYGRQVEALYTKYSSTYTVGAVGYSAGGVIARSALSTKGVRVVTWGSPHKGTDLASLGAYAGACDVACSQMNPGSDFLKGLPDVSGAWLSLYSPDDKVVFGSGVSVVEGAAVNVDVSVCGFSLQHSGFGSNPQVLNATISWLTSPTFVTVPEQVCSL